MKRIFATAVLAAASCAPAAPSGGVDAGNDAIAVVDADVPPQWDVVLEHLDGALLSMWGTSPSNVTAVGGSRGNGFASLVVHYDGSAWKKLEPGGKETFWWLHGSSATDIWMVGEKGRITHWDGTTFKEHTAGTTATLFGVWASSPNDAWAVGGTPEGGSGASNDVVVHWDGTAWSPSPLPKAFGRTLYKVWGSSANNLYVVGEAGTIWHRTGTTWALESDPPLAHGTLVSVFGCSAGEVYAVGGRDVLRSNGKAWSRVGVTLLNDVNGVSCGAPGEVVIVGFGGLKQRLVGGIWKDDFGTVPYSDLHGAWVDPSGGLWGVGGNFIGMPAPGASRGGVIARYGKGTISRVLMP